MDPIIGAGIVSAAGSVLGNVLGFGSQQATNKANMKLAQYQYEKNLEMWNRQNEYNSPMAQMQRLKDAGLNPNMVYGNGSAANQASNAPSYEAPRLQAYTNFGDLGAGNIVGSMLTARQIENMDQQNRILQIDAEARRQQMLKTSLEMAGMAFANKAYREDYSAERELKQLAVRAASQNLRLGQANEQKLAMETEFTKARARLTGLQGDLTQKEINQLDRMLPEKINQLRLQNAGYEASNRIEKKNADMYEKYNVRPSDPLYVRALVLALDELLPDGSKAKGIVSKILNGEDVYVPNGNSSRVPKGYSMSDSSSAIR